MMDLCLQAQVLHQLPQDMLLRPHQWVLSHSLRLHFQTMLNTTIGTPWSAIGVLNMGLMDLKRTLSLSTGPSSIGPSKAGPRIQLKHLRQDLSLDSCRVVLFHSLCNT